MSDDDGDGIDDVQGCGCEPEVSDSSKTPSFDGDEKGDGMNNVVEMRKAVEARRAEGAEKYGSGSDDSGQKSSGGGGGITSRFVIDCLNANELGDGLLYRELLRDKFVFNKSMDKWMKFHGHFWDIDYMDEAPASVELVVERYLQEAANIGKRIREADGDNTSLAAMEKNRENLLKRATQLRSRRRRNNCLEFAHQCEDPLAVKGDEFDRNPWLLPCPNCVIDLKTGLARPGRPDDFMMRTCRAEWQGIDAPREAWEKALLEIMGGDQDMVDFLQRLFGMSIVGAVYEHVFPVLTGPRGRNGKTTIAEGISYALGSLAGPIPAEMLLAVFKSNGSSGPTPDIMSLRGLRVAWASETEDGAKVSAAKVKWLTGGDSLTGRYPHDRMPTTFEPTHTLFLLSNFKPHADGLDNAYWERIINIPFEYTFVKNREPRGDRERKTDPELKGKIRAEASGILAWLVQGCLDWQRMGLCLPPKVIDETDSYQQDEDNISSFVKWCCVEDEYLTIGATDLYNAFEKWWKKHVGNFPPKQKKFGSEMRRRFKNDKVGGVYKYFGVGLNYEVMEQYT